MATTLKLWPAAVVPGIRAASWASARGRWPFTALARWTPPAFRSRAGAPEGAPARAGDQHAQAHRRRLLRLRQPHRGEGAGRAAAASATIAACCAARRTRHGRPSRADRVGQGCRKAASPRPRPASGSRARASSGSRAGQRRPRRRAAGVRSARAGRDREAAGAHAVPLATALVAVEREGIIDTAWQLNAARRPDPTIEVKIDKWAPNVYVSVLACADACARCPGIRFFQWGWKAPHGMADVPDEARNQPPAMVDLAKPAFRWAWPRSRGPGGHRIQVSEAPTTSRQLPVRQTIQVSAMPGSRWPAPRRRSPPVDRPARAAMATTPGICWIAMLQPRPGAWRHRPGRADRRPAPLRRKGGGRRRRRRWRGTRELFDTLLWKPRRRARRQGEAVVGPLNDSLTSFRLVAVPSPTTARNVRQRHRQHPRHAGSASAHPGLPPLVREGDQFRALHAAQYHGRP